jgi:hypothetical protein
VESAGYVVPSPAFLAAIFHSLEERQNVAAGDRVVIDAGADRKVQVGDQLTIFRRATAVRHPLTDHPLGTAVVTLGSATVVSVQPTTAIVRITQAFDAIAVGDYVKAFAAPPLITHAARPTRAKQIAGIIVATKEDRVVAGEGDIVYLDRGEQHGVARGDRFEILEESQIAVHPISHRLVRLPREVLGVLTVIDVRDRTSTAFITDTRREIAVGTPVELRTQADGQLEAVASSALTEQLAVRLAQLTPCLEAALQTIRAAEAAGATAAELTAAKNALAKAEQLLQQAQEHLARGDVEQALSLLQLAQTDCLTAQELGAQARTLAVRRAPILPEQYTVVRGDTLWGISARETIYRNPFMWPLIYFANRHLIRDPDLIFPRQLLTIPRNVSQEQAETAVRRARTRGPWRLKDGPDTYILEGVRR